MSEWPRVKWTEAAQIFAVLEQAPETASAVDAPKGQFDALVAAGELPLATRFLAAALPRYEAVVWATRTAKTGATGHDGLIEALDRWVADPSDDNRRIAFEAGEAVRDGSPAFYAAAATFFSGGSIAPPDLPPVQPDPHVCGRLASSAVIARAYATDDPEAFLKSALAEGAKFAEEGVR